MPRPKKRGVKTSSVAQEIRHSYSPGDQLVGERWKELYVQQEPITIGLDVGTFMWLWDFVDRKGRQADSDQFQNYSAILGTTYQRAANQFAVAAKEAFGDTYKVDSDEKKTEVDAQKPAEALESPPKRRKKRKAPESTAKNFSDSKSLTEPSKGKPVKSPRSKRRKRTKTT